MRLKIACISDTHGFLDDRITGFIQSCDEIWHAGDIGTAEVAGKLSTMKPLRAVYGNIDGPEIRAIYPAHQRFEIGGIDVWITHAGGYPGRYDKLVIPEIFDSPPGLFICGHSHILKVINDSELGLLHVNPGAAGISGPHTVRTAVRFVIDNGRIRDLEVAEFERK